MIGGLYAEPRLHPASVKAGVDSNDHHRAATALHIDIHAKDKQDSKIMKNTQDKNKENKCAHSG